MDAVIYWTLPKIGFKYFDVLLNSNFKITSTYVMPSIPNIRGLMVNIPAIMNMMYTILEIMPVKYCSN